MTQLDTRQILSSLETQIADLKRQLEAQAEAAAKPRSGVAEVEAAVKAAVKPMTIAQIMSACGLQKSSTWMHVNRLEKEGKVWLQQTHRPDGRKHTLVHHADNIAV